MTTSLASSASSYCLTTQVKCHRKWGIHQSFSAPSTHSDELLSMKHAQKIRDVKNLLKIEREGDSFRNLTMVDAVQRLGIDHHFREEIETVLWRHYLSMKSCSLQSQSLHQVSLSFRLLRQEGYHVPSDVFNEFVNEKRRFNLKHEKNHIEALMGLYEAAQLRVEGEDILDDAARFTSQFLKSWMRYLDDKTARMVGNALRHPLRKSLARFKFDGINGLEKSIQELSSLESYMARGIHRQELLQISKWWKDVGMTRELKRARDQPLKWYAWPMAMLKDLSLSDERVELTKTISFIYLIDDIFDLYGKPEDLTLFTQAVNRWELAADEQLPDYIKKGFRALYDMTIEAGFNMHKKHGFNPTESLRETWSDLCNAFLIESRWFASGSKNLPNADEYLKNGKVSSGVHVVLVHLLFLLGFGTTKETPLTINDASGIISSVAAILRLWDDLGSSKDEDQNGYDGSYITYYLGEHEGVEVETAREHIFNMISDEWKRFNMECLRLNRSSSRFQKAALNLARMVPLMYGYDHGRQLPHLQHYINSTLYEDISDVGFN